MRKRFHRIPTVVLFGGIMLGLALNAHSTIGQTKRRRPVSHSTTARKSPRPWTPEQTIGVTNFTRMAKRLEAIFNGGMPRDVDLYLKESSDFAGVTERTAALFPEGLSKKVVQVSGAAYVHTGYAYELEHPSELEKAQRGAYKAMREYNKSWGVASDPDPIEEEIIRFMQSYAYLNPNNLSLSWLQRRIFEYAIKGRMYLEQGIIDGRIIDPEHSR